MKSDDRALAVVVLTVVVVAAVGGAYFLTAPPAPLIAEVLAGTQFQLVGFDQLDVSFAVPSNGTLVGAWVANTTACEVVLSVYWAGLRPPWVCATSHTFDDRLRAGEYVLSFSTVGATQSPPVASGSALVTVVQTIQVVYS